MSDAAAWPEPTTRVASALRRRMLARRAIVAKSACSSNSSTIVESAATMSEEFEARMSTGRYGRSKRPIAAPVKAIAIVNSTSVDNTEMRPKRKVRHIAWLRTKPNAKGRPMRSEKSAVARHTSGAALQAKIVSSTCATIQAPRSNRELSFLIIERLDGLRLMRQRHRSIAVQVVGLVTVGGRNAVEPPAVHVDAGDRGQALQRLLVDG